WATAPCSTRAAASWCPWRWRTRRRNEGILAAGRGPAYTDHLPTPRVYAMPRTLLAGLSLLSLTVAAPAGDTPEPPARAVSRMKLPPGFRAELVAAEPQLVKPIAMTTDDRGRLWVVESHSYPRWRTDGKEGRDRILIFE